MNQNYLISKIASFPRWNAPKGTGIITSVDTNFFPIFQVFFYSIQMKAKIDMEVYDIGLTQEERVWCENQSRIQIRELDKEKYIIPHGFPHFQNWNKPMMLLESNFERYAWIDADCILTGRLEELFGMYKESFVVFECSKGWRPAIDLHSETDRNLIPHQTSPPVINNGVMVLDSKNDRDMLIKWKEATEELYAIMKGNINKVVCWDQGALQWVLEKECLLGKVFRRSAWNQFYPFPEKGHNINIFFKEMHRKDKINHYCGKSKYKEDEKTLLWKDWPIIDSIDEEYLEKMDQLIRNIRLHWIGDSSKPPFSYFEKDSEFLNRNPELGIWHSPPQKNKSYYGLFREKYGQEYIEWDKIQEKLSPKQIVCLCHDELDPPTTNDLKKAIFDVQGLERTISMAIQDLELPYDFKELEKIKPSFLGLNYFIGAKIHDKFSKIASQLFRIENNNQGRYTNFMWDGREERVSRMELFVRYFFAMYATLNPEIELCYCEATSSVNISSMV